MRRFAASALGTSLRSAAAVPTSRANAHSLPCPHCAVSPFHRMEKGAAGSPVTRRFFHASTQRSDQSNDTSKDDSASTSSSEPTTSEKKSSSPRGDGSGHAPPDSVFQGAEISADSTMSSERSEASADSQQPEVSQSASPESETLGDQNGGDSSKAFSPFDTLFDDPNAFERSSAPPRRTRAQADPSSRSRGSVPHSVLYAGEQDARHGRPSRRAQDSSLTPAEKGIFDSIFNTLAESRGSASGTSRGSSARLMSLDDAQRGDGIHGAFGPDVDVQSLRLSGFAARNRVRGKQMTRDRHGSRAAQLREDLAGKISPEDLEAGVDRAKEEMAMCESEPELWDWARREVWGLSSSDAKKKSQASETGASGSSTGAESVDSTAESALESSKALVPEEPKYGVATPFYAPVLHALHVELRDTFRAPLAALAVPRITRGAGLRSFVLGCTSALYAECIRTRWECLGDVHGAAQALREARDAGFVGLSAAGTAGAIGSRTEDEPLREVVERVRTEVRAALLGRLSSSPSSEGEIIDDFLPSLPSSSSSASWAQQQEVKLSTAAQEQLRLVEEMGRIAGKPSRMVPGLLDDDDETFGGGAFGRYDRSPTTRRRSSRESSQSSRPLRERKTDRPVYLKSAYLKYGSSARQPAKRDAKPW